MSEKDVQDALLSHFAAQLGGDYPDIVVTAIAEEATEAGNAGKPFLLATPESPQRERWLTNWEFLLQFSASRMADADTTPAGAVQADRDMITAVWNAVNDDASYALLRDAGLLTSNLAGRPEDQRSADLINPHLFTCRTNND